MVSPASKERRKAAFRRGAKAELYASLYLWLKGYKILKRRYKTKVGEIDLIALKLGTIVVVEVKARDKEEDAAYSITSRQRQRIERATEMFLSENPGFQNADIRFDAVLMVPKKFPIHIKNAWGL